MQFPPISWLPLRMVIFNRALFLRALSRFEGTAPQVIQTLYAAPMIIAALNALLYIQNHGREIYSSREISVEDTAQIEAGRFPVDRLWHFRNITPDKRPCVREHFCNDGISPLPDPRRLARVRRLQSNYLKWSGAVRQGGSLASSSHPAHQNKIPQKPSKFAMSRPKIDHLTQSTRHNECR